MCSSAKISFFAYAKKGLGTPVFLWDYAFYHSVSQVLDNDRLAAYNCHLSTDIYQNITPECGFVKVKTSNIQASTQNHEILVNGSYHLSLFCQV